MTKLSLSAGKLSSNKEMNKVTILSASIAHEFKNYLAGINMCAELSESELENIREKVRAIRNKVKDADYLINNLQLQIKGIVVGEPSTEGFRRYSIAKNIEEVLEQYPFKTDERKLIAIVPGDFKYIGNPILTNHIFYNLIKNSLRAIQNSGKGSITIKFKLGVKFNELVFRDTATGIAKEFLPKIVGLFESQMTAIGGTGVGLAFCKTIMNSYGGDIICNSIEGRHTEFTLKFLCISDENKQNKTRGK
jgi:signal transduction histidine kinase